jgi:hypothetical protein
VNEIKRLTDIAQRLDELSDEGPAELSTIAEDLGGILETLEKRIEGLNVQVQRQSQGKDIPRYLHEIYNIVQNEVRGAYRLQGFPEEIRLAEYYRMQAERDVHRPLPSVQKMLAGINPA